MSDQNESSQASLNYDFFLIIEGMTCRSCEVMIERKLKKISGVNSVEGNAQRGLARITYVGQPPAVDLFKRALGEDKKYNVKGFLSHKKIEQYLRSRNVQTHPPSFGRIIGVFVLAILSATLFAKLGLIKNGLQIGSSIQFGAAFVIGLIAAISSCVAVIGGLLISSVVQYQQEQEESGSFGARTVPVGLFVGGRVLSYAFFGGIIGWLGSAFAFPPIITGGILVIAALTMLVMGLDMLHLAPPSFKRLLPGMPKSVSHRLMDMGFGKASWIGPFFTGAVTFFVPCGFTQALQLYALTSGSFAAGAIALGGFALGTVPALSALGFSLNAFKGSARTFFFQFAGALIIIMGIVNIQNGFAISGYPLSFQPITNFFANASSAQGVAPADTEQATLQDGKQELPMTAGPSGYTPSDLTVKAGIPVEWNIDATNAVGCEVALQVPGLGIRKILDTNANNTIEFTAQAGTYPFSCSMGMYRGVLHVN